MAPTKIEEIAVSFVNGNISWVKSKVRTKKDMAQVIQFMQEMGWISECESFIRIMSK